MKFVMSYSCGKDSALALYRMLRENHEPVGLLVVMNEKERRTWFHGVDAALLEGISDSLGIPLILCWSEGEDYCTAMEQGMKKAAELGAQYCVFGDIDIQEHFDWCVERCRNTGLWHRFPLWQEDREALTNESIALGFCAVIKCIDRERLPVELLGRALSAETVQMMKEKGIDVCGENGEYHTVVVDGPIFRKPVGYKLKEKLDFDRISVINIEAERE